MRQSKRTMRWSSVPKPKIELKTDLTSVLILYVPHIEQSRFFMLMKLQQNYEMEFEVRLCKDYLEIFIPICSTLRSWNIKNSAHHKKKDS